MIIYGLWIEHINICYWKNEMKLLHLFENDDVVHAEQLKKTGFWGKQGAGCLPLCSKTKRFLLNLRSGAVEQPHTYGTWGGAIDSDENPREAALREFKEEAGFNGTFERVVSIYTFKSSNFSYYNFLIIIPEEFTPKLDWESAGFKWCDLNEMQSLNLHFGVKSILNDEPSMRIINNYLK